MSTTKYVPAAERAPISADERRTLFWAEGRPEVPELMHNILVKYSGIPEDETISHVESLRDRAWKVHPYPCIGRYRFLTFALRSHRLYESHILKTLKAELPPGSEEPLASPLFLEIGTCFGQELRALVYQGVPVSRVYGVDIEPAFIDMGYDLFRDQDKFPSNHQIAPVDLFDAATFQPGGRMEKFIGKVDILALVSVFHLWSWEKQVQAAKNVLPLMRRGGVILGAQTANIIPTEYPTTGGQVMYRHNSESWEEMWTRHVTDDGTVTDPRTKVQGAKLEVHSELIKISQRELPKGISVDKDSNNTNWRSDEGFRWMKYEVWVGKEDD